MAQPLDIALNELNTTIQSIGTKVDEQVERSKEYKKALLSRLSNVSSQLKEIETNSNLQSIPQLKQQLAQLQQQLNDKTSELQSVQDNLTQATKRITDLETNINDLTKQIGDKDKQILDLTNSNSAKDTDIKNLNDQKQALEQEKKSAQDALAATNLQVTNLVKQIDSINQYLQQQIQLIDRIVQELGTLDSGNIAEQFGIISTNIEAIRKLINSGSGGAEEANPPPPPPLTDYDVEQNIANLSTLRSNPDKRPYLRFIKSLDSQIARQINDNIGKFNPNDNNDPIRKLLQDNKITVNLEPSILGGKRRHKTIKKKHRRTRKKMRGGYIYSSSKLLDKASSVISSSSSSKSKSKSQVKDKTRRKFMK